ncbi:MAG: bacteriohemerythrin [Lachnospiraceae bacterium]
MFIWKSEFELGIKSIDDQHKKLLEIGNKIGDLVEASSDSIDNFDEIMEVLGELKDYTEYHFETEEILFAEYGYEGADDHKIEHDAFVDYLNAVNFDEVDENQKIFLQELLNKIIQWVFKHIISTDFLYKDFLLAKGVK